jgi:hypothetical protein
MLALAGIVLALPVQGFSLGMRDAGKEIDLVIPGLSPGAYQVRLTTRFSGSHDSLLKNGRTTTFLIVPGASPAR